MSDIFKEVEEDVRRERLHALWSKYGGLVLTLAVVIVLAVAGWRGWEWWQHRQAEAAGARFEAALRLVSDGNTADADAALAKLAADAPTGYALLARFARAGALASTDKAAAVREFDALAGDAKALPLFRDLAQIRAGLILVDDAPYADLKARLEPLAAPEAAFRHSARELLALSAWKAGDRDAARQWVDALVGDPSAPSSLRTRGQILRDLLSSPIAPMPAPAKAN
ncbi:tetratricopeptide repeat protein [Blastochloris viridis]|uniref:Ancillary SecYEG translocon subunit/Cell division coordinator CpoB TPR domain-containing protein n=1 Tax=Blastochloris viridis TaxID=1079 RepID=A0A0H5B7V9_BLAVI|nr:tetratricopeptide repeat protein [Blastochloris viridis]ALK08453.1 hypothetical protein BVIR_659 [Blastochloris viridis]BAR98265.1 hypothetical protein BV133_672 [Blastochloris viridis]CUU41115.1 hypothetical protein BVIRIDIS_01030 [Blastochloris viridis]